MKTNKQIKAWLKADSLLARDSRATLFDRVQLWAKIVHHTDYRATLQELRLNPDTEITRRASEVCAIPLTNLLQILKMFPRKLQWVGGNLSEMNAAMLAKVRETAKPTRPNQKRRNVISHAQFDQLMNENKLLRSQISALENDLAEAKRTIANLNKLITPRRAAG